MTEDTEWKFTDITTWPTWFIIVMSVVLVLVIIAVIAVLVWLIYRHKNKGANDPVETAEYIERAVTRTFGTPGENAQADADAEEALAKLTAEERKEKKQEIINDILENQKAIIERNRTNKLRTTTRADASTEKEDASTEKEDASTETPDASMKREDASTEKTRALVKMFKDAKPLYDSLHNSPTTLDPSSGTP